MTEHVLVDCLTQQEQRLTQQEAIAHPHIAIDGKEAEHEAARQKAEAAAQKERNADLAVIKDKAKTDPAFAALARHLGIV